MVQRRRWTAHRNKSSISLTGIKVFFFFQFMLHRQNPKPTFKISHNPNVFFLITDLNIHGHWTAIEDRTVDISGVCLISGGIGSGIRDACDRMPLFMLCQACFWELSEMGNGTVGRFLLYLSYIKLVFRTVKMLLATLETE